MVVVQGEWERLQACDEGGTFTLHRCVQNKNITCFSKSNSPIVRNGRNGPFPDLVMSRFGVMGWAQDSWVGGGRRGRGRRKCLPLCVWASMPHPTKLPVTLDTHVCNNKHSRYVPLFPNRICA